MVPLSGIEAEALLMFDDKTKPKATVRQRGCAHGPSNWSLTIFIIWHGGKLLQNFRSI